MESISEFEDNPQSVNAEHVKKIEELKKQLNQLKKEVYKPLALAPSDYEGLKVGIQANGKPYSVRDNRDRYFFPEEWFNFFENLKNDVQKFTFELLINTGARINEIYHIKWGDVDTRNNRLVLRVTKVRAKKKEKAPRPRQIAISSQLSKKLARLQKALEANDEDRLPVLSRPATHLAMEKALKKAKIKDWYMFSIHNVRKTHGNWIKALGMSPLEICNRLGHDYNTFIKSYGSANVFTLQESQQIKMILGDLPIR